MSTSWVIAAAGGVTVQLVVLHAVTVPLPIPTNATVTPAGVLGRPTPLIVIAVTPLIGWLIAAANGVMTNGTTGALTVNVCTIFGAAL